MPDTYLAPLASALARVLELVALAAMREAMWTAEDVLRDSQGLDLVGAQVRQSWEASLDDRLHDELRSAFVERVYEVAPHADAQTLWSAHWDLTRQRLALWPDGLLARLSEAVGAAQDGGGSLAALRAAMDGVLEDGPEDWRVQRLALTETLTAINGGAYAGAVAAGITEKTWQTVDDADVRPEHARLHDTTLPIGTPFLNGGQFPGDPALPPGERVNCRCLLLIDGQPATDPTLTAGADMPDAEILPVGGPPSTTPGTDPVFTGTPNGWRGVLAPLGVMSSDGRLLAKVGDAPRTRPLPMQLGWQKESAGGHTGAVVNAARIDRVWYDEVDGVWSLMGEGAFDLEGDDGKELSRLVHEGFAAGVSVDLSDAQVEWRFVLPSGEEVPEPQSLEEWIALMEAGATEVAYFVDWELGATTFVNIPAFAEARVAPVYGYAPTAEVEALVAAGRVGGSAMPGEHVYEVGDFSDPRLDGPTPLTIESDGRVYGHAALWKSCHVGYANTCQRPPHSKTGYAGFHVGEVLTSGGSLPVGRLTVGGGHADPKLGLRAALTHYDDVATQVAVVRAGEDDHGVWVAGHVIAGTHPDLVSALRRSPLSGDWRALNGNLEMVAAHAVNVPGFGIPRAMAASAGDRQISLVAAAVPPHRGGQSPSERFSMEALADAVVRRMEQRQTAKAAAAVAREQLARRVGVDKDTRRSALAARMTPGGQ